ncbi:MEKHLA domain-containing protein [Chitinibacter bivalviorum]|uniref:MEKHLA domain-containing protein n=1 Tax=Chitinibacter bivalviorum TaxID=2739434 RepID=A0A7H9BJM9_9NEIS|nr:MEKHLA domain-containing protein [Chitinibacter bivalviorum]QLG88870.1 MEKHLA domain-containing protein [Chitinibacter bivalviorum]
MTQLALVQLMLDSYRRLVGRELLPADWPLEQAAHWLQFEAPFCVLAHEASSDPRFIFANTTAQRCFEYSAAELIGLPSRLSAEAPNRQERQQLLDTVSRQGYATGYRGLRIAKSGRRFWIENVTVWNLIDDTGVCHGQAATYEKWQDA